MDFLDAADKIAYYATELNNITSLIGINLANSDISKSNELERITFLTEYTKQLASELDNLSTSITDDLKSIKHE